MGLCLSAEEKDQKRQNADIDAGIKKDKKVLSKEVKLLILGAGESGKSTILKQMVLIHGKGYSDMERESFKEIIFSNTVQSMKAILDAMEKLEISIDKVENKTHAVVVEKTPSQISDSTLPAEIGDAIRALWKDAGVQSCFGRSREYQLNDSAKYYFEAIDRIGDADFVANDQDILRSRVKTTGIIETTFHIGDLVYRMFDVGGQRSERKKWMHCFESVTAILFLVAVSEFDQVLVEDETMNRMQEALTLFEQICNSKWFITTSMILFLNKIDLFKEKLSRSPLNQYFSDYKGSNDDFDEASTFFRDKFVLLNQNKEKEVYTHFTCATDTTQIKFVMAAVNDIIVQNNLRGAGLM